MEEIYGIGPVLAKKINNLLKGRNFNDHYKDKDIYELLPAATIAYLKYKPVDKIKRSLLVPVVKKMEKIQATVAGSYRRGVEYCRDLDILVSQENLPKLLKSFNFTKPHAEGQQIIRCFIKILEVYVFADIFIYTDNYLFLLLYTTGSKQFNKNMRGIAKKKGYKLNQNGLFKNDKPVENIESEEDIFKLLDMHYLEPYQRNI